MNNSIYIGSNYPNNDIKYIVNAIAENATVVSSPDEADFFLFPIFYEVMFEYNEHQLSMHNYTKADVDLLKSMFNQMVAMAENANKKVIIFYYRDPIDKINIKNAIIFRTSLVKSGRDRNEFALPAFVTDIREQRKISENELFLQKTDKPTLAFMGQTAPMKLPRKVVVKRTLNKLFKQLKVTRRIPLFYNFGYMQRRDAVIACLKNKKIKSDIAVKTQKDIAQPNSKEVFLNNLLNNQYNLCVSGHGNYSFRLYETLSAGRIPVFIDTDCVLPFEEFVDWKKHVVWIESKDADKTDKLVLEFHNSKSPEEFLALQKSNRQLFEEFLTPDAFYRNLFRYFQII